MNARSTTQSGSHARLARVRHAMGSPGPRVSKPNIQIRRAYEPAQPGDGYRVLVDRLWPRGRSKASLRLTAWAKELAPSTALRTWFGHDPARWIEFKRRYQVELRAPERVGYLDELTKRARAGMVTLVYGARDQDHNEARVLAEHLGRRVRAVPRIAS
jgi:uncharacterized protein YeaO (DUF488 family)